MNNSVQKELTSLIEQRYRALEGQGKKPAEDLETWVDAQLKLHLEARTQALDSTATPRTPRQSYIWISE